MTWPTVAVVVLNWNGREYLTDCLTSLRQQEYPGRYEVVVADNGSSDGSVDFVRQAFPDVRLIVSKDNLGFGGGNNFAVDQLDAEAIAFLNNDTRVDPRWLAEQASVLGSAPDIAAVGGKILTWDGTAIDFLAGGATLTGFGLQLGWKEHADAELEERDILAPCGGSMLIWRDRFLEVGGYDADYFLFYEDLDLGWRLWLRGWRVRSAPRSVAYHRHHGSVRRLDDRRLAVLYERNALFTIYKNYDDAHLNAVLPAALILAAEKALLMASPDRAAFASVPPNRPGGAAAARVARSGALRELREGVRRRGMRSAVARLPGAARRRLRPLLGRIRHKLGVAISGEASRDLVPPAAIATLLAIEQFGENLPQLRAKRKLVQSNRRRPDEEILKLFGLPLEPLAPIEGFAAYHRHIMATLQLDAWVSESAR